jgi:hypothetical protein
MARYRGTTTERGLGHQHRTQRAALLPIAIGQPCPGPAYGRRSKHCTRILLSGRVDADHTTPRALGGKGTALRMCCTPCNRGAGAALGNRLRATRRRATALPRW